MSKIADHYNASAPTYSQQYQRENLRSLPDYPANYFRLEILMRQLARAGLKSVYEVGVGEGTPLARLAATGLKVAGCDIAKAMVKLARESFARDKLDPESIQWGDIEDPATLSGQLKDGPYDALIAAGVLPHMRDDGAFLDNIAMFVRPGGRVFVEFRNKLFSLFTLNRFTKEFLLDDLLRDVAPAVKQAVSLELDRRLAMDSPPLRAELPEGSPGYDAILSKFHNPFELLDLFAAKGYRDAAIHWYHYHPAPPWLEGSIGAAFRESAMALEHEQTWRGWFLCSAGVVEAVRS